MIYNDIQMASDHDRDSAYPIVSLEHLILILLIVEYIHCVKY